MQGITLRDLMHQAASREATQRVLNYLEELGGATRITGGAALVPHGRFVNTHTDGTVELAPTSTGKILGISDGAIPIGIVGKVRISGRAEVYPSATVAAMNELVAAGDGFAAPALAANHSMTSATAGADASDDIDQTNLPDQVSVICGGDETGNTVVIYGKVGSTYTKETVTLGTAGTYTSTATFAAVYCLQTTATSVGTIDIKDASLTGLLIPQIAGTTAARMYGAIATGVSDDAKGLEPAIKAGGANASDVVIWGTDYASAEQAEIVTMNGTTYSAGAKAYRTITHVFIGADGIAWNAGVTSQYTLDILATKYSEVRAIALAAQSTAGRAVECMILPQRVNQGLAGQVFWVGRFTTVGGAAAEDFTVPGVAATDAYIAVLNVAGAGPQTIDSVEYKAANTVTVTFSANPSNDHQFSLLVLRP